MVKCYDNCHHFSTPSPPLMIGIIIEVNDENCGRPLGGIMLFVHP